MRAKGSPTRRPGSGRRQRVRQEAADRGTATTLPTRDRTRNGPAGRLRDPGSAPRGPQGGSA
eukprot:2837374-Heterocapsa_arctica.AAC.1